MAFRIVIDCAGEHCDICDVLDKARPMLRLSVTSHQDRNFVWMHLDCFERRLAKAKKKAAAVENAMAKGEL